MLTNNLIFCQLEKELSNFMKPKVFYSSPCLSILKINWTSQIMFIKRHRLGRENNIKKDIK
jgi:hypothetical protein